MSAGMNVELIYDLSSGAEADSQPLAIRTTIWSLQYSGMIVMLIMMMDRNAECWLFTRIYPQYPWHYATVVSQSWEFDFKGPQTNSYLTAVGDGDVNDDGDDGDDVDNDEHDGSSSQQLRWSQRLP